MTTNVEKFLAALVYPFQELEDAFQSLMTERTVDTAVGAQLTAVGKLVGCDREGVTDDDIFRRHVRAQIATNKSDGLIEDLITVTDLVVYDDAAMITIRNLGACAVVVRVDDVAITQEIADLAISYLRRAVAGGVRVIFEYAISPPAELFRFDSGPGWDQGKLAGGVD